MAANMAAAAAAGHQRIVRVPILYHENSGVNNASSVNSLTSPSSVASSVMTGHPGLRHPSVVSTPNTPTSLSGSAANTPNGSGQQINYNGGKTRSSPLLSPQQQHHQQAQQQTNPNGNTGGANNGGSMAAPVSGAPALPFSSLFYTHAAAAAAAAAAASLYNTGSTNSSGVGGAHHHHHHGPAGNSSRSPLTGLV